MKSSIHSMYYELGTALGMTMPKIAEYHCGPFSVAVILADPGGVHTANSGAQKTLEIGLKNPDPTARFLRKVVSEVGFGLDAYLPLNALAGYDLRPNKKNLAVSAQLNSEILKRSGVRTVILGGGLARSTRDLLSLPEGVSIVEMPHPSARGRGQATIKGFDGSQLVRNAFENASIQIAETHSE